MAIDTNNINVVENPPPFADISYIFSAENKWYWLTILIIFSIPILLKMFNKIRTNLIYSKNEFGMVVSEFTNEVNTYSFFGKQKTYHTVGFSIDDVAKQVTKREFGKINTQKFYLPIREDDFILLKKIGLNNPTGLTGLFSNNRFGFLYFIGLKNKNIDVNLKHKKETNILLNNTKIAANDENIVTKQPITSNTIKKKKTRAQIELDKLLKKD